MLRCLVLRPGTLPRYVGLPARLQSLRSLIYCLLPQTLQWLDVCSKLDFTRYEALQRLNAALVDASFLAGASVTIADYLAYYLVAPLVVCVHVHLRRAAA